MTQWVDELFGCADEAELGAVLEVLASEPDEDALLGLTLYAAASDAMSGREADDYEYREIGYEGPSPRYDGHGVVMRWLRARMEPERFAVLDRRVDALSTLLFGWCYEDWWDFEAYDWGGEEALDGRVWFSGEELQVIMPLLSKVAPMIVASDWVSAMLHVSLVDLLESGALRIPQQVHDAELHPRLGELQAEVFAAAFCRRHDSIELQAFLASHERDEAGRRRMLLELLARLPPGHYLERRSHSGYVVTRAQDYSRSFRDDALADHLETVLSLDPPVAYCRELLSMIQGSASRQDPNSPIARAERTLESRVREGSG